MNNFDESPLQLTGKKELKSFESVFDIAQPKYNLFRYDDGDDDIVCLMSYAKQHARGVFIVHFTITIFESKLMKINSFVHDFYERKMLKR